MPDSNSASVSPRRLPKHSSLEQLKKQAKELLEQFRANELAAVVEVGQFERNPDPSHFALNGCVDRTAEVRAEQMLIKSGRLSTSCRKL